jgi:long-chain fatty acid transport protein
MALRSQIRRRQIRKNIDSHLIILFFLATLLMIPGVSTAGGLYINEFGTPSMGVAGAGANAVAEDASTSFHNAAGMTRIRGNELMGTGGLLYATVKFDPDADTPIPGGDGGDAGGPAPIIGGFYVHSLSDKWKLGANLITITGAVLDYDDDWTGRYLNTEVTLLTMTFYPSVAYRVNNWLSLGGGPQIMYADLEMKAKVPLPNDDGKVKIDGDDVAFGFSLGALFEVSERTRFGVVYQSEIEPEFDGDVKISGPGTKKVGTDTKITLAQFIRVSGYHELNDRWALLGTVGWEDWSAFKPKRFRATGRILGSLLPESISARRTDGFCRLVFLTTPARWTRMIAHRICPWTVRFVMPPGFSISGTIVFPPGRSSYMPTTARPK